MSRPKLGYTERVEVRLSPALLDLATRAAESEAVPLTEWFRRAALTRLAAVRSKKIRAEEWDGYGWPPGTNPMLDNPPIRCVHGAQGVCAKCDEEHE